MMRRLKMRIEEDMSLEGVEFHCTVEKVITSRRGTIWLVVTIDPPLMIHKEFADDGEGLLRDIDNLFSNGIDKAILQARRHGVDIAPHIVGCPVLVYVLIPKKRLSWDWGPVHVIAWAKISEE